MNLRTFKQFWDTDLDGVTVHCVEISSSTYARLKTDALVKLWKFEKIRLERIIRRTYVSFSRYNLDLIAI